MKIPKGLKPICWAVTIMDQHGDPVPLDMMRIEWTEKKAKELVAELNARVKPLMHPMPKAPFDYAACYLTPMKKASPRVKRKTRKGK